jgi:Putative prokaryotic signal transducing protein
MRVVATSNDPVRLSFLRALLADAGIVPIVLDAHASIMDGSIGAIQQRLMVKEDDFDRATQLLRDCGEC